VTDPPLTAERRRELARDLEAVAGWRRELAELDLEGYEPLLTPANADDR